MRRATTNVTCRRVTASVICLFALLLMPSLSHGQDERVRLLAQDNIAFGMDLYEQFREQDGNLFFSPYSISEAFAMLYAGARGETAEEMAEVLHISLDGKELHEAYRAMGEVFDTKINFPREEEWSDDKFRLNIANGFWTQEGFPIRDDYVSLLQNYHNSEPASLDFANDAEQSRQTINTWVSDRTEGMIEDILPKGAIGTTTSLVLANTVYFEAKWYMPFVTRGTYDEEFHRLDNTTVMTPMMHNTPVMYNRYTEDEHWQAATLEYRDSNMGMLIILPRTGKFSEVEHMFDEHFLASLDDSLHDEMLKLTVPKFAFTSPSMDLKNTLLQLGIQSVFANTADLSGISAQKLVLAGAYHKASVTVDEEGTIAAGATVLPAMTGRPSPEPIEFTADRPFIFLIRDLDTKAVLFMGRVLDPTE